MDIYLSHQILLGMFVFLHDGEKKRNGEKEKKAKKKPELEHLAFF